MNTSVANSMINAGDKTTLDQHVKNLFGHKAVLVPLLQYCVPEFKGLSAQFIMENCFVGDPIVGRIAVDRDVPADPDAPAFPPREIEAGSRSPDGNTSPKIDGLDLDELVDATPSQTGGRTEELLDGNERVQGLNTEDKTQNEGTAIYDIVFQVRVPSTGKIISLLINVEIQNDKSLSYETVTRGIFYCARMLSAQKNCIFKKSEYEKLQKVYSIWICPYSKSGINSISAYDIRQKILEGEPKIDKSAYDKLETVIITLNKEGLQSQNTLIRYLSLLLNRELGVEERQKLIEDEYHIAMTDDIVKDVKIVCNYSEAIELVGREKGRQEGRQEGREEGKNQTLNLLARLKKELKAHGREREFDAALDDPAVFNSLVAEFQLA